MSNLVLRDDPELPIGAELLPAQPEFRASVIEVDRAPIIERTLARQRVSAKRTTGRFSPNEVAEIIRLPLKRTRRRRSIWSGVKKVSDSGLVLSLVLGLLTAFLFFRACQTTFFVLFNSPINADAGFYLSTARALAQGDEIYKTIFSPYTPVGTFLISLLYPAADHLVDPYLLPILMVAASHIIVSFLVYILLRKNGVDSLAAAFTSILCYNLCLRCEGDAILLESFTMVFGLLALLFYTEGEHRSSASDMFIAGAAAAVCFLCKQYGLSVMAILTLLAFNSQPFRLIFALFLGQAVVLSVTALYLLMFRGTPAATLTSLLQGGSFIHDSITHRNLEWFVTSAIPGVFVAVLLYPRISRTRNNSAIIGGLLISLFSASALLLRDYYHYLLLLIPGLFVFATAVVCNLRLSKNLTLLLLMLVWSPTLWSVSQQSVAWPAALRSRSEQYQLSKSLAAILPKQSPTLLLADTGWSYLLKTRPVPAKRPSFGTIDSLSAYELQQLAARSDWLLLDLKTVQTFVPQAVVLRNEYGSWENLLTTWGFTRRTAIDQSVQLWEARPETRLLLANNKKP